MAANLESIEEAVKAIGTTEIVSCPLVPIVIPGVTAAAYTAGDCIGTVFKVKAPKHGVFVSAILFHLSDITTQTDVAIFNHSIASAGDNSAYAPSDDEVINLVGYLAFVSSSDHANSRVFELTNIGKAYSAPEGVLYLQVIDRSSQTLVAANIPKVQVQIQSFDPDFKEV